MLAQATGIALVERAMACQPVETDRARIDRRIRDLALERAAGCRSVGGQG